MVAWYWLIISAIGGIVFAKFCEELFDWDNFLTETISFLTLVVCFIPIVIYNIFFKLTLKHPVERNRWEELHRNNNPFADNKETKITKNLYLCYDLKAKRIWNKIFFVRIKENSLLTK